MVRGPRRSSAERRAARKVELAVKYPEHSFAGMSILEMLEADLLKTATSYVRVADHIPVLSAAEKASLRGQMRGIAKSIALMRHPLRRYEQVWWNYVKKIEKRAVVRARESLNSDTDDD